MILPIPAAKRKPSCGGCNIALALLYGWSRDTLRPPPLSKELSFSFFGSMLQLTAIPVAFVSHLARPSESIHCLVYNEVLKSRADGQTPPSSANIAMLECVAKRKTRNKKFRNQP